MPFRYYQDAEMNAGMLIARFSRENQCKNCEGTLNQQAGQSIAVDLSNDYIKLKFRTCNFALLI